MPHSMGNPDSKRARKEAAFRERKQKDMPSINSEGVRFRVEAVEIMSHL